MTTPCVQGVTESPHVTLWNLELRELAPKC